jgi:hypothetical protein
MLDHCLKILPVGSKIFSMDPTISKSTSNAAKWFAMNDRGNYVRTSEELERILVEKGLKPSIELTRGQMRIPLDTVEITIQV